MSKKGEKPERIEQLRARIVREMYLEQTPWQEVWFFPEKDGVLGWRGTEDIIFVGLNPSTGRFSSNADRFFYAQLRNNSFQKAHLTDVIKRRGTAEDVEKWLNDSHFIQDQMRYLEEEVRIIEPQLIVPLGKKTASLLRKYGPEIWGKRLVRDGLPHYSQLFPSSGKQAEFVNRMKEIRQQLDKITADSAF
ncbi:MAG: uracil-DNA glycosylase family protein [Chloroflexi bacterium]|nr:uracil-DNA glycosylase family protein [Chloroflexota bacterium]